VDPDDVLRSGSASVSNSALSDGHVDFRIDANDKIDSDNGTTITATLTYDYWMYHPGRAAKLSARPVYISPVNANLLHLQEIDRNDP